MKQSAKPTQAFLRPRDPMRSPSGSSSQWGGTIIGFILGVVVGLAAALAMAVYVTKVPIPFMSGKTQARSADHDAAENRKNKDWDPNSPLYGKNPARPAPAASAVAAPDTAAAPAAATPGPAAAASPPAATAAVAPAPDKQARAVPQPVKVEGGAETKPVSSVDPLGDLARARTAAATPAPAAAGSADPFDYFVQAGAFRTPEDAEAQRAKLAMMGLEARVTEREQAGRTVFRVRMGPYGRKEDAEKTKDRLDATGADTALVRVQR